MEHTGFPSDETLAAFIDGKLDAETRRRVVEHMASCNECYGTYLGATEWGREGGGLQSARSTAAKTKNYAVAAAGVFGIAAVLAVVFFAPLGMWYHDYWAHDGMVALVAAANELDDTPVQGRLSGGFEFKPIRGVTRSGKSTDDDEKSWKISEIATKISSGNPSVEQLRTLGAAKLILGDSPKAVEALERAICMETRHYSVADAVRTSDDARLLSDLGAAYYQKWSRFRDQTDLQQSLEASERAWRISKSPESAWNRALGLESLRSPLARAAWQDYVDLDHTSEWAKRAMEHLRHLEVED